MSNKLILITTFNIKLNALLGTDFPAFDIFRSKGLLTHLLKRKHYTAAKYIDYLAEIINSPDFAGYTGENIELVKKYKDNIFICIKLDVIKKHYYVSTMYEIKSGKIEAYVKSGRLKQILFQETRNN